ncbi:MAG TPA: ABC transporter ATP-binding protein [Actinobacteria bacterium]|nr:ABC transporter ATP-binding protein [Actinomycetota bacterium]
MTDAAFVDEPTIVVDDVGKWFGSKVAVSGISCSFGPGVTGLLGPNGAGKTTLLRLLTGLLRPSQGRVTIFGLEPRRHPEVYRRIGLVPEEPGIHPDLSARAYVRYAATLSGTSADDAAVERALEAVDLLDVADRRLGTYSKGMTQRAKVAAALVADPDVLVLDEPLNGTDPVHRARLIDLFRDLGDAGKTIVVSSHVLEEVERMADRVLAVVDGRLAAAGTVAAIRRAMSDIPYRVRIAVDDPRRFAAALLEAGLVDGATVDDGAVQVETADLAALGRAVARTARELDVHLVEFRPEDASLESVFRYLVRRRR